MQEQSHCADQAERGLHSQHLCITGNVETDIGAGRATLTERPVPVDETRCAALVGVHQAVIWPLLLGKHPRGLEPVQQQAEKVRQRLQ